MNLSEDCLKGLEVLADEKIVPNEAFRALIDCCFDVVLKHETESALFENSSLKNVDVIALKQTYSAFIIFILETMKSNIDNSVITHTLEDHKLSSNRIQVIIQYFNQNRIAIRKVLSITNFHYPHIIDVNWRLDYFMKSNSIEKVNTPVYLINLTTEKEEGEKGEVEFACTLDQLQDLVFKLRDAQKQIERSSIKS
ncbi:COMM domain-containing protein 3 [Heterostelium album PN500]|uniref:COMM domain-containing protein 3 n=1 Tax=Heterostelium pallidum (strain ATCC 26659 / Pp 5 / PN500) TaxID=670386 RepID=D3BRM1_HETP5|nr:COMM domain-containing protein 3 [Heterostelium album PN500]EFA76053.1 COMM domain-containing protein 3 [Heterostelium album PN500]|eukprot:XP_020428187.1 COMM domain-containing protein 3 [Heterostelium album PN500]